MSGNPFADLTEHNMVQITKYLKFFRGKKDAALRSVENEFYHIKQDKLNEDMFTKEEMVDFADFILATVRGHLSHEMGALINMGALSIGQLLESADYKGVEISLETSNIENHLLLEAVEKMSLEALPRSKGRATELVSLKDEARAAKEELECLQSRNSELEGELKSLKRLLRENATESKSSGDSLQERYRILESELHAAREESAKRVGDSSQFQQMKKMMQTQTGKIKDLRRRLEKYEDVDDDGKDGL